MSSRDVCEDPLVQATSIPGDSFYSFCAVLGHREHPGAPWGSVPGVLASGVLESRSMRGLP